MGGAWALPAIAADAAAATEPHVLVRQLVGEQARIIQGDRNAFDGFQKKVVAVSRALQDADTTVWIDNEKNTRAAIKLVLSGGPPGILKKLLAAHAIGEPFELLAKATVAFAEGRKPQAYAYFQKIDHRRLSPSLGGHVALVKALVGGAGRSEEAYSLLDDACLLSPGTIVEEAALRRHAPAAASAGRLVRFEALALRYFRRFPNSLYGDGLLSELAVTLARQDYGATPKRVRAFERILSQLTTKKQQTLLSEVLKESLALGHIVTARFSLTKQQLLPVDIAAGSAENRLYEAATLILSDDFDAGVAALERIDTTRLQRPELQLAEAAGRLVTAISKVAVAPDGKIAKHTGQVAGDSPAAPESAGAEADIAPDAHIASRRIIDAVDSFLAEIDS